MKKVLFLAAVLVAALTFTSCKKKCTCTDKTTGETTKVDLDKTTVDNCADYEKLLQEAMQQLGSDHKVSCK